MDIFTDDIMSDFWGVETKCSHYAGQLWFEMANDYCMPQELWQRRKDNGSYGADYEEMKARQKRCVCRQCGSELEIRMIIFCQYGGQGLELYCPVCQRIEYGVEKELFALANKFIKETEFNYFLDMPEDKRSLALNKAKIGELFSWLFYELGLCDKDGLTEKYKILQE